MCQNCAGICPMPITLDRFGPSSGRITHILKVTTYITNIRINWEVQSNTVMSKEYNFCSSHYSSQVRGLMSVQDGFQRWCRVCIPLQWRHNGLDSVSNHQPHHCLLSRLFGRRSKKTSKLRVTGLCAWNSPGTSEFPAQMASYAENVSIWWRHHAILVSHCKLDRTRWYWSPLVAPPCLCRADFVWWLQSCSIKGFWSEIVCFLSDGILSMVIQQSEQFSIFV